MLSRKQIAALMLARDLSYRTIAERGGGSVTAGQIWRVLNGRCVPTLRTLKAIARGMGLTIDDMAEMLGTGRGKR